MEVAICQRTKEIVKALFPLAMAGEGEAVRIVSIWKGHRFRKRLMSMGLQKGDVIVVVRRMNAGAVLISRENHRFAMGGGMAMKILVKKEA